MKKILGSPIGLGEVNLTVDNRVRRNIKEYFGNVDNKEYFQDSYISSYGPEWEFRIYFPEGKDKALQNDTYIGGKYSLTIKNLLLR